MKGYLGKPGATAEAITGGCWHSCHQPYCVVTAMGSADALSFAVTAPAGGSRGTRSPSRMSGVLAVAG